MDSRRSILTYQLTTATTAAVLPDPAAPLHEPAQALTADDFMAWAKRTPEQIAISQGRRTWSYRQLAAVTQEITVDLLVRGLVAGDVVAIYGATSFGLIAAALATLRSGGVLLFIEPNLPSERQHIMLTEANARFLVDTASDDAADHWRQAWPEPWRLILNPDTGEPTHQRPGTHGAVTKLPEILPTAPAYIFFTSGTTRTPRGILGSHKGLSHFLSWQRTTFQIRPTDRCAQLTALSFDVVLRSIFLPLTTGATLCIPEKRAGMSATETLRWLEDAEISVLHLVPSLAAQWLAAGYPRQTEDFLRWVFFSGEPLTEKLVHRWRSHFLHGGNLVNLYGPTETTMATCYYHIPENPRPGIQPIGRAIADSQALIINDKRQLCGVGEIGQIAIRTPFRTLGYINNPVENDRLFVPNPYAQSRAERIYLTGDLGRYEPDGMLTILGRTDHQVKIRGVRVEPAEISAVLADQPGVLLCEVVVMVNPDGENALVAYVVPDRHNSGTIGDLRSGLRHILPGAMIPSRWVLLEQMPLMANGKIDRHALPPPQWSDERAGVTYVAPRTQAEETVARVWADILQAPQVSIFDDFFDLGGHSLLAIQIISRLRREFALDIPLITLFEATTVAEFTEQLQIMLCPPGQQEHP